MNTNLQTWRDHPRLCGEKRREETPHIVERGSPPPMRGKAPAENVNKVADRITPAYAGKSDGAYIISDFMRDHPRLYGEKSMGFPPNNASPGSPPPMRGKVKLQTKAARFDGITPAYAGKSIHSCHPLSMI